MNNSKKRIFIYIAILAFVAMGNGLSDGIFSNYFKEAYNVSAFERGVIEFPRELPGMLCIFVVSIFSFMGDIRLAIVAQLLAALGVFVLGVSSPSFNIMLIFLFINSMGMHLFMPLNDSISISLIEGDDVGKRMGQFRGVSTAFTMFASILVFLGFRYNFFSFTTKTKWIFIVSAIMFLCAFVLFIIMHRSAPKKDMSDKKFHFLFRKEYKYYYILAIMNGVQKQIMIVYGPWVLIDILNKRADSIAILSIIGSFIGIFFIPALGKWLDKYGIRKMLYADALSFIGVYALYGILSWGLVSGVLSKTGFAVACLFGLIVLDKMSMQMSMIRVLYLRSIAVDPSDITPTLSLGISMDHIVSITCAYIGGIIWTNLGPQYIFFIAASMSIVNLIVAKVAVINEPDNVKIIS